MYTESQYNYAQIASVEGHLGYLFRNIVTDNIFHN